ncbi:hypothetical protein [Altererythrobacter sp. MF3-039]|uniref:hypothetical protein n=1 Tax=Altererythrobacter sp. MF3-039 TaxID=3252901 RepID=UPI00390C819A
MVVYDILLVTGVLLFSGISWLYLRHPAASFYHPLTMYLAMHGIVFTIRPILSRIFDYQALYISTQFEPSLADKITVLVAANLALVVFAAVSLWIASRPVTYPKNIGDIHREHLWVPFLVVAALVAPIALYSAVTEWIEVATDASTMTVDRYTGVNYNTANNGWLTSSQLALVPLVSIFAWLTRFRWYSFIPFALFFIMRAGTGGRGPIIIATAAIIILFLLDRRRQWPEWRSAMLIVLAAFAFNAIVADRGKAVREMFIEDDAYEAVRADETKPFEHMDFANLEYFEFAVYAVPQRSGTHDYFLHNLQIFTEPIPRIWWNEKPLGPPIAMYDLPDYGRPYGFTYSIAGIGWLAWGWPGVAIQAAIFALLFSWFHRRMANRPASPVFTLVFAVMIASAVVSFRDGTLLTVVRVLPFYIGPVFCMWALTFVLAHRFPSSPLAMRRARAEAAQVRHNSPAERRKSLAALAAAPR